MGWCNENSLDLNTSKTEELVTDYRSMKPVLQSIYIKGEVGWVPSYKYLGVARRCRPPMDHQNFRGCEGGPTTPPLSEDTQIKDRPAGSVLPPFH